MIRKWGQGKDETWEKVEGSKGERGICAKDTEEQEKWKKMRLAMKSKGWEIQQSANSSISVNHHNIMNNRRGVGGLCQVFMHEREIFWRDHFSLWVGWADSSVDKNLVTTQGKNLSVGSCWFCLCQVCVCVGIVWALNGEWGSSSSDLTKTLVESIGRPPCWAKSEID